MGTILASAIVDKAEILLRDSTNVQWTAAELLGWLNDGQREIVVVRPDANALTKTVQLVAGTRQTLGSGATSDAVMLLRVVRNMGTTGTTPGNAIRVVPWDILDTNRPGWHSDTQTAAVQNIVYDPRNSKQFYVYPPNTGAGYVEMMYSAVPTAVASLATAITLDDVYANALLDYILYRAYSTPYVGNATAAAAHLGAFQASLGAGGSNVLTNSPNLEQVPMNPSVPGAAK